MMIMWLFALNNLGIIRIIVWERHELVKCYGGCPIPKWSESWPIACQVHSYDAKSVNKAVISIGEWVSVEMIYYL